MTQKEVEGTINYNMLSHQLRHPLRVRSSFSSLHLLQMRMLTHCTNAYFIVLGCAILPRPSSGYFLVLLFILSFSASCYYFWLYQSNDAMHGSIQTISSLSADLESTLNHRGLHLSEQARRAAMLAAIQVLAEEVRCEEDCNRSTRNDLKPKSMPSSNPIASTARRLRLLHTIPSGMISPETPPSNSTSPPTSATSRRILITGGAGFIGSHVARALLRRGDDIVIVDELNDSYAPSIKLSNLAQLENEFGRERIHMYVADVCDELIMNRIFEIERFDRIIHLAARVGVRPSLDDPALYLRTNVQGTLTLLELAKHSKGGIKHFVYASSSSVYGDRASVPFSEDDSTNSPMSPYAATKKACELLASTYADLYAIPASGMRFFTVYGENGRRDMAPFMFIDRLSRGLPIIQFGDGTTERDYTYIDDIVQGVLKVLDHVPGSDAFRTKSIDNITMADTALHQVYNLGAGSPIALSKLIDLIAHSLGVDAKIEVRPPQLGDVHRTFASIAKARRLIGYNPQFTLEEGIRRTVAWYNRTIASPREKAAAGKTVSK